MCSPNRHAKESRVRFSFRCPHRVMTYTRHLLAALFVVAVPLSAQQQQGTSATSPFDVSNRDTTCAACTDFYRFANGGWIKQAQIPAAYPMWGTLIELTDRTEKQYTAVIRDAAKNVPS